MSLSNHAWDLLASGMSVKQVQSLTGLNQTVLEQMLADITAAKQHNDSEYANHDKN